MARLTIGLSRGSGSEKYVKYAEWLNDQHDDEVETIDLFEGDLDEQLSRLDALVLTGGGDVNPERYGHPEFTDVCTGIIDDRDERESRMIAFCETNAIPILGICRGLQYLNVHYGGTLIPHIPDDPSAASYHLATESGDNHHTVSIEPGSLLARIGGGEFEVDVNSSHHQAIGELADVLTATAQSEDGLVEAIEWREPHGKPFMLAVQWHPERMVPKSPLSERILAQFLMEAASAQILKRSTPPTPKPEEEMMPLPEKEEDQGDSMFPIIQ